MNLFTEFFLAWKYFKPKRSAVSVITLISVVGVSLGVAVLIVVLAVMTGFTDQLKNKLLETGAHAQIQKQTVYSYNVEDEIVEEFYMTEMGYVLIDEEGTCVYYNENGKELLSTEGMLTVVQANGDQILYSLITEDGEPTYYIFKK